MSNANVILLDLSLSWVRKYILTSNNRRIAGTLNTDIGLSDYHNVVAFSTKLHFHRLSQKVMSYRSYKLFDEEIYRGDISFSPFHVGNIVDDFEDPSWFNQTLLSNIIDSHAPIERKRTVKKHPAWTLAYVRNVTRNQCYITDTLDVDLNMPGKTIENHVINRMDRNGVTQHWNRIRRIFI